MEPDRSLEEEHGLMEPDRPLEEEHDSQEHDSLSGVPLRFHVWGMHPTARSCSLVPGARAVAGDSARLECPPSLPFAEEDVFGFSLLSTWGLIKWPVSHGTNAS